MTETERLKRVLVACARCAQGEPERVKRMAVGALGSAEFRQIDSSLTDDEIATITSGQTVQIDIVHVGVKGLG